MKTQYLWELGLDTIRSLEVENGILASGREEVYGCIFGRDSLITSLKLLQTYEATKNRYFLELVKKILSQLALLQGKEINIESGEEPGKCIHEYRPTGHERLTASAARPWFLYKDNSMRNYDSVDSTPLFLIAIYRYWQQSRDKEFLKQVMPHAEAAIDWILCYGDSNQDGFIDYQLHPNRTHGGLVTQNWMDSAESLFHEDDKDALFPVAPVEVQAYTYCALQLWAAHFASLEDETAKRRSRELAQKALQLKQQFNQQFVFINEEGFRIASALDGAGNPIMSVRSNIGHCLWASLRKKTDGAEDCVVEKIFIPPLVERLMKPDMFEERAGIRTLSTSSPRYNAHSYHNGSIWPHDTAVIAEGLAVWGFIKEATAVRTAMVKALEHFKTPVELFVYQNSTYEEYKSLSGQGACRLQAWSAASLLEGICALENREQLPS